MTDWSIDELGAWDDKICEIGRNFGLNWFDIDYEIIDYHEMISAMSYTGLPTHYRHWSFGKAYERTHMLYNAGASGLPYEMIIKKRTAEALKYIRDNPWPSPKKNTEVKQNIALLLLFEKDTCILKRRLEF